MTDATTLSVGHDETVYLLKPPAGDWPQTILAGPRTADPTTLEQEFIKERDGNIYTLDSRRFDEESFVTFVNWLKERQGFRAVEWCAWIV